MNNQPKRAVFKYDQHVRFCLGLSKVESKEYETITGRSCLVLAHTGRKIVTIDAYKKEIQNQFSRIKKLT